MYRKPRSTLKRGANMRSKEDLLGSYTGVTQDGFDEPVQDADDL